MFTSNQSSKARFLRFLRTKNKPSKSNTGKKATPSQQIDTVTQEEPVSPSAEKNGEFPLGYYKPRPVPKSFVVGEVRKVFSNGSPPELVNGRQMVASSAAIQSQHTINMTSTANTSSRSQTSAMTSPKSRSPVGRAPASPVTQSSEDRRSIPNGVSSERPPRPTFNLLLGQQDPTSPYFTRRYFSESFVADANCTYDPPKDILHHIAEVDPQAFDMYKSYIHSGKIGFRCPADVKFDHVWIVFWPLMNAHILGCIIEEPAFADKVMDILVERLTIGTAPDLETVRHLFDPNRRRIPGTLKAFVVDLFITAQQRSQTVLETSEYPEKFTELVLRSALRHLSYIRSTSVSPRCQYHIHGENEACYTARATPVDTLREQRLAAAREKTTRDVALATANSQQYGVKGVDWELRQADVKLGLRIDTGSKNTGSGRLENSNLGHESIWNNATSSQANGMKIANQATDEDTVVRPTNGTGPIYCFSSTPNTSPVLKSRSLKTHLITTVSPAALTNGNVSPSQHYISSVVASSQTQHPIILAELDGSSSEITRPTEVALKCKPSIDRIRNLERKAPSSLVVVNGTDEKSISTRDLPDDESALKRRVGEPNMEHERCMSCPGAYPESSIGV